MKHKELQVIKQAIINEIEGFEFYSLAAKQAANEESKIAFEALAQEELLHVNWLKKMYKGLSQNKEDDLLFAHEIEASPPKIFKWSNVDRKSASLAVSVFGIAVQMEKESIKFYDAAAKNTDIEKLKGFYNTLSSWEKGHLEQFAEEYDNLKEDWWNLQDFEPM